MVADATDDDCFEALIVGDSSHVGPDLRLEFIGNTLLTLFCAKDYVDPVAGV